MFLFAGHSDRLLSNNLEKQCFPRKSYTFENVSSPHTIEAIFVKGTASASTGDSSNLPLWSALLLASTLALAGAVHLKRKRAR